MNSKSLESCLQIRTVRLAALAVFLIASAASALAQTTNTITLTNSDGLGLSSFNAVGNWNSGMAPATGNPDFNAYFTTNFTLRTPTGVGDYTFAGDSLEIDTNGGVLGLKGSGIITVNNLILNGGKISNSGTGGSPDTGLVGGNIYLQTNPTTSTSTLDGGGTAGVTALNILAPMTGPGSVSIIDNGTVIFSGTNMYAGNTTVATNSTLKINSASAIPHGPGNGFLTLSPGVNYSGILDLNGFDTTVNSLSAGGSLTVPSLVTNSALNVTNTLTVDNEVSKTYKGFINEGVSGKLALTIIGSNPVNVNWVLSSNLNYSGDTTINDARLTMGQSGNVMPWGNGKGNIIVTNGGILDLAGRSPQVNGLFGNGVIDNYSAGVGAGGHSTFNCGSNDVSSTFSGIIQNHNYEADISTVNAWIQIVKFGAGTLTLAGTNTFNGNVAVHAGVLRIVYQNGDDATGGGLGFSSDPSQGTPATKVINIDSATGDAGVHFLATNGAPIVVTPLISWQTAGTNGAIVNEAGNNTIYGSISLRTGGGTTIRVDGDTLTLAGNINILANTTSRTLTLGGATNGIISGAIADGPNVPDTNILSLAKSGAGTWTLATNNTYSDATTINGGTLALGVNGSISNTPAIDLQGNAAFDVSATGGWVLGATQTLSGSGNIAGNVTANGTVAPGETNSIGALNFSNHLALAGTTLLKLNRTSSPTNADSITAGTLARGGTLTVTNTGNPLQVGDSFHLFHGSLSGTFAATNLPSLSSPLYWDTSLLGSQGILTVASTGSGTFTNKTGITSFSINGLNLVVNGTNGQTGDAYYLLASTNMALPLSQWTTVATNVLNANGSFTFTGTNVVTPGGRQQFYILSSTNANH